MKPAKQLSSASDYEHVEQADEYDYDQSAYYDDRATGRMKDCCVLL